MRMHPDPETLAAVATGDPPTSDLAAHLATCPDCAALLDDLRSLDADLAAAGPIEWAEPPESVWAGIRAGIQPGPSPAVDAPTARRRSWIPVAVAAALGLVAGIVGGRSWWPATPAQPVVVATTNLQTLEDRRDLGRASLLRANGNVELSVQTQPLDPGPGYLEVWLINTDGRRMVSVGVLADNTTGLFPVSTSLLQAGYRIVDISRESFDDKPTHSGDSLARGELQV